MDLGNFALSLNVKDIHKSKEFYEKLGFEVISGDINQNWLILKNGTTKIGLFQGMFESNILTFNPKWDSNGMTNEGGDDIRDIYQKLENENIEFSSKINDTKSGPNHFMITDPDGNNILFDQHV